MIWKRENTVAGPGLTDFRHTNTWEDIKQSDNTRHNYPTSQLMGSAMPAYTFIISQIFNQGN